MHNGHGNNRYRLANNIKADFSSNVWFKTLPGFFYQQLSDVLKTTVDYPEPKAAGLTKELASFHGMSEKNIWVTNGSIEGIYLIAQVFAREKSAIIYPSFSEYEDACKRYNHSINFYSNTSKWQCQKFREKLIWFGNPNNPDGKKKSVNEVEYLLSSNPSSIFIIDEAFSGLCANFESALSLTQKYENLVVLRSFTKSFAIPGIRLGYVLAPEWIVDKLSDFSIPWSVNTLAIEAGKIILQNYSEFLPDKKEVQKLNVCFRKKLNELPDLEVIPSDCNYFLIRLKKGNAGELKKYLVHKSGILVRDASNFRGLDNGYIRLSVQTEEDINLLVLALKSFFNEL